MTKSEARDEIRLCGQACEEIGVGYQPLSTADLQELEERAQRLLTAVAAYRASDQPAAEQS